MKINEGPLSQNIEDRRGTRMRRGGLGIGGFVILLILSFVFKRDLVSLFGGSLAGAAPTTAEAGPVQETAEERLRVQIVSNVLDSAQVFWSRKFSELGAQYEPAKVVLFRDAIQSGCGAAQSATGPFYCPADQKVYIDLSFYDELAQRFGASGDFAQAYVLAHEIGHHVQTLLGVEDKVRRLQQSDPSSANQVQVRMELQADCLAGIWGREAAQRGVLQPGDAEEGLNAAAAVGDDRIQKNTQGYVNPDAFTHGSSEQRAQWFTRGIRSGRVEDCDTFSR